MSSIFRGVLINDEHSLQDWGAAITNSDVISMPEPNTTYLEIPGRNGRLDLSEVLTGDVTFSNRTIKLQLAKSTNAEDWYSTCLHIFDSIHGRSVKLTFDDDLGHYYVGRASVSNPQRLGSAGQLLITVDADPFRYEQEVYSSEWEAASGTEISGVLVNTRKPACPTITVDAECNLVIGTVTYALSSGEQTLPSIILPEGETSFIASGATSIKFSYQRGCL
jgi:phage-related protein